MKVIPLFNNKDTFANELTITKQFNCEQDEVILYQSTKGDELFWKETSHSNIFDLFNKGVMPYTYLLCLCYKNECRMILGPFTIKYEMGMKKIIFEEYILYNIVSSVSDDKKTIVSISNIGKVLDYSSGIYRINTLYKIDIYDEQDLQYEKLKEIRNKFLYSNRYLCNLITKYINNKLKDEGENSRRYNPDASLYKNLKDNNVFIWGLIGNEMIEQYSLAPIMWTLLFEKTHLPITYKIIHTDQNNTLQHLFDNEFENIGTLGFNVAMPWKEWAYSQCECTNSLLRRVHTVNTIYRKNNKICGDNTDGIGLIRVIKKNINIENKVFLILGAGGVVQTLPYLLSKYGAHEIYIYDIDNVKAQKFVSREEHITVKYGTSLRQVMYEELIYIAERIDVVVNGTPCGMYGRENEIAITEDIIVKMKKCELFVESIYNPYKTKFLKIADSRKIKTVSGVDLLVSQAMFSFYDAFGFKLTDLEENYMKKSILSNYYNKKC